MVLWYAVVVGVVVGLCRGGRFSRLAALRLRHAWLVVPAVLVQLWLVYVPPASPVDGIDPLRLWLPMSFLPLAVFLVTNRHLPGMRLMCLGFAANASVILANGGLMPTNEAALVRAGATAALEQAQEFPGIRLQRSKDIVLSPEETRLLWLSDVLVSPPIPRQKVLSIGDLLVAVGIATLTAQAMMGTRDTQEQVNARRQQGEMIAHELLR